MSKRLYTYIVWCTRKINMFIVLIKLVSFIKKLCSKRTLCLPSSYRSVNSHFNIFLQSSCYSFRSWSPDLSVLEKNTEGVPAEGTLTLKSAKGVRHLDVYSN